MSYLHSEKIKDWSIALGMGILFFGLAFCFFLPVLNSDDDVFLMYQLSGGFGEPPDNLLHFDHVIHPWLGFLLSRLFLLDPQVNWYSWFFGLCQFFSWVIMGRAFLFRLGKLNGSLIFLLLFALTGINCIQSLNMTSAAWLLSIAGMVYLFIFPRAFLFVFILLLLAASIRLQIPLLVAALFIPIQWLNAGKFIWRPLIFLGLLLLFCFLLNLAHKSYYASIIPGWEKAEGRRQDLFYAINRPRDKEKNDSLVFDSRMEKAFYQRLFLYNDSFPSGERIKRIGQSLVRVRDLSQKEDRQALYWNWIAWRLYFVFIAILLFLAWKQKMLSALLKRVWLPLLGIIAFYCFLFIWMKFTAPFFIAIILMIALQFILSWPGSGPRQKSISPYSFLFIIPIIWTIHRDLDINRQNRERHAQFVCAAKELASNNEFLFISTGDAVPLNYFSAYDVPANYPLSNYLFKEMVITKTYQRTFDKFGLGKNLFKNLSSPVIRLVGPDFPELIEWVNTAGDSVHFSSVDTSFHCLEVRRVLMKQSFVNGDMN